MRVAFQALTFKNVATLIGGKKNYENLAKIARQRLDIPRTFWGVDIRILTSKHIQKLFDRFTQKAYI